MKLFVFTSIKMLGKMNILVCLYETNTPFTRSSKHRVVIKQTSSKCIQNTRARRVL